MKISLDFYLQEQDKLRKSLHRFYHQPEKRQSIVCADLFHIEKVCKRRFSFCLDFRQIHCVGKVVNEAAVIIQDFSLAKGTHEHVADLLVLIPVAYAFVEWEAEEFVAFKDVGHVFKENRHL